MTAADIAQLQARLELVEAASASHRAALEQAVKYILRVGGYMAPEDHHRLLTWQALLAESR